MNFVVLLSAIISALFSNYALLFIMSKILNKKMFTDIKAFIVCYLALLIISFVLYFLTDSILRIILFYLSLIPICYLLFKDKINKIIFSSFLAYILMACSEIFAAIILLIFVKDNNHILQNYALKIPVNILIFITGLLLAHSKKLISILQKVINRLINVMVSRIMISSIIGIFLVFFVLYCSYYQLPVIYLLITDFLFLACYIYTICAYFREISVNVNIKKEYEELEININEYERMYNTQKMANHEHKNQLLTIKSLANKKDKKITSYIDSIIKENIKEDNEWFERLKIIPNGGMRGILYYKILDMKDKNINANFIVSKNINSRILNNISLNTNVNLCKILGVILDNAIQAVKEEKEKNISIEVYRDGDKLIISISNNFSGNLDFSKIGTKGFTTKGSNHGYGLSLVKYLVNSDNHLENYKEINGNIFTQIIKIRI